jgi:uncharacterized lipoprotein YehR (DUF1307 family)
MSREIKEIQEAYANMSKEEQEEFDKGMREHYEKMDMIAKGINDFIKHYDDKNSEQFTLDLYQHTLAFARVAVINDIDVGSYMSACMDMYIRMGGNVGEDSVTPSHSVH